MIHKIIIFIIYNTTTMYKNLDAKSKEIVMRRLQWRILTDLEPYDEKKYDEYCMKYLSDEIKDRYVIRTR